MKQYKVGIYLRLSRDDGTDNESMSISNQRDLLTDYIIERGWEIEDTYIDDGFSGTTFDRPGFQRLIEDIESKRINMVIVKDLSRLGRNYSQVGHYTDYFFPKHNVRFIAIGDNVDSEKDNDFAGFLNVIHEHYAKDTSRKIKTTKKSQMKKGEFIGSQPALGYMRDPQDKHHLIIEPDGAQIVRRIFHMYTMGESARHIAEAFNKEGIPTPRVHFFNRIGKPNPYTQDAETWGSATILRMLRNQVYIGHMVQGKRQKKNFKMKRRDVIPKEQWVVVKNTHEPLIDEVTWSRVQSIISQNKRRTKPRLKKDGTISLFSAKVFCADCDSKMTYQLVKIETGEYPRYRCSTYSNQGKSACSFHAINEPELEAIVLSEIQKFSSIAVNYADALLEKLLEINDRMKSRSGMLIEKQLQKVERELQSIAPKTDALLEQLLNGNVSEAMFKKLMSGYEVKQEQLSKKRIDLKSELSSVRDDTGHIQDIVEKFKARNYIETLDRETVVELIDHIEVYKKEKADIGYTQRIDIYFNFIGKIDDTDFENLRDYMSDKVMKDTSHEVQAG